MTVHAAIDKNQYTRTDRNNELIFMGCFMESNFTMRVKFLKDGLFDIDFLPPEPPISIKYIIRFSILKEEGLIG